MRFRTLPFYSFAAVAIFFLATAWLLPAIASPGMDTPSPSPTPVPTPDFGDTKANALNFWFILLSGGVLLGLLVFVSGVMGTQILALMGLRKGEGREKKGKPPDKKSPFKRGGE